MSNYNVEPITKIQNQYLVSVDAAIDNEIRRLHQALKDVLSKGFQACIEIENLETNSIDYCKGIMIGNSGSFAKVKMETLKKFQEISMTGICTIRELIDLIHRIRPDYDVSGFSRLENPCQLTRIQQEELRREIGITAYLGGIRVPFTRHISSVNGGHVEEKHEARFGFSALSGESDLTMCCLILHEMQVALQKAEANVSYSFDLSELRKNQAMNFLLHMYGIKEICSK